MRRVIKSDGRSFLSRDSGLSLVLASAYTFLGFDEVGVAKFQLENVRWKGQNETFPGAVFIARLMDSPNPFLKALVDGGRIVQNQRYYYHQGQTTDIVDFPQPGTRAPAQWQMVKRIGVPTHPRVSMRRALQTTEMLSLPVNMVPRVVEWIDHYELLGRSSEQFAWVGKLGGVTNRVVALLVYSELLDKALTQDLFPGDAMLTVERLYNDFQEAYRPPQDVAQLKTLVDALVCDEISKTYTSIAFPLSPSDQLWEDLNPEAMYTRAAISTPDLP